MAALRRSAARRDLRALPGGLIDGPHGRLAGTGKRPVNEDGGAPFVLICEHGPPGTCRPEYADLGLRRCGARRSHRLDIGAAAVTANLPAALDAPAFLGTYSRLADRSQSSDRRAVQHLRTVGGDRHSGAIAASARRNPNGGGERSSRRFTRASVSISIAGNRRAGRRKSWRSIVSRPSSSASDVPGAPAFSTARRAASARRWSARLARILRSSLAPTSPTLSTATKTIPCPCTATTGASRRFLSRSATTLFGAAARHFGMGQKARRSVAKRDILTRRLTCAISRRPFRPCRADIGRRTATGSSS